MKEILLIGLILSVSVSAYSQYSRDRAVNFPREEILVDELPAKNNLWIFLLAGQSNMAGRAFVEPCDTVSNARVLTIDKQNQWILAKEPLHFYEPAMTGLDCGLSLAQALIQQLPDSVSVALIPCAIGGSSIEQWVGDSLFRGVQLLCNFKEKVEIGKRKGIVKGILWCQGESDDSEIRAKRYKDNLEILIEKFRKIAANDSLPVFIGELGRYAQPAWRAKNWRSINRQKGEYVSSTNNSYLISSKGLHHLGDHTHLNSASQRKMGKRFAKKIVESINADLSHKSKSTNKKNEYRIRYSKNNK